MIAFEKKVSKNEEYNKAKALGKLNSFGAKFTYYFFMRHGERTDFYFKSKTPEEFKDHPNAPPYLNEISHDPTLTATGLG